MNCLPLFQIMPMNALGAGMFRLWKRSSGLNSRHVCISFSLWPIHVYPIWCSCTFSFPYPHIPSALHYDPQWSRWLNHLEGSSFALRSLGVLCRRRVHGREIALAEVGEVGSDWLLRKTWQWCFHEVLRQGALRFLKVTAVVRCTNTYVAVAWLPCCIFKFCRSVERSQCSTYDFIEHLPWSPPTKTYWYRTFAHHGQVQEAAVDPTSRTINK